MKHGSLNRVLFASVAAITMAAASAARAAEETIPVEAQMSWQEIVDKGGWILWVQVCMSVITITLVVYFAVVLRSGQVAPRPLLREVLEKIRMGSLSEVRRACEYRPCNFSNVVLAGMDCIEDMGETRTVVLRDVIEGEGCRQAESIQAQTQYLLDIAVIAPMLGLLGTLMGMMRAFSAVALRSGAAKPVLLASGVSEALITTAAGLIVGIVAMVFYAYFRRRAARVVACLEMAASEVMTAMLSTKRVS